MKREEKIKLIDLAIDKIKKRDDFFYLCSTRVEGFKSLTDLIPGLDQRIGVFFIKHGISDHYSSCFQQLFVSIENVDNPTKYDSPENVYKSNQFRIRFLERFKKTL